MNAIPYRTPIWPRPRFRVPAERRNVDGETVDVAIVGGGILGLSTALHLARFGKSALVFEAKEIGQGASGVNGGQVIPGLKFDPEALVEHFGERLGEQLVSFAASTADRVFDLIAKNNLDVPHLRNGWIQAAHSDVALAAIDERDRQWRARGANVERLDAKQVAALTGAKGYAGGWLDRRAGVIDPLAYTLELARIAMAAGAQVAEHRQVVNLRRENGLWTVSVAGGSAVKARSVLLATNAHTDRLVPGLAQTIVPLHSFQIATAPLPTNLGASILPGGQAVSDSRRILVYYRKGPDGRLVLGGRGRMSVPTSAHDWEHLERAMLRLYPTLKGTPIEKRWFGRVAMTPDHLPHIHEPEKGLLAVLGCQGRGIGLMTALGESLANYLVRGDPADLPIPRSPIRPIPFHSFHKIGVAAAITWYRLLDATER